MLPFGKTEDGLMNFENSLFTEPLLVGIIFIIAGLIMLKFPPKKINMLYGYRTLSSMKNQKNWDFAQRYSSILMMYCGFGLLLFSGIGLLFTVSTGQGVLISTIALFATVGVLIYFTEKAIKQNNKDEE